jgi:hypothetical protein
VNGVTVSELGGSIEAIRSDPTVGRFTFKAETEWQDSLKCVTRINEFD